MRSLSTSIFDKADCQSFIDRLNKLTPDSKPAWGSMDVCTMLRHCSIAYEDYDISLPDKEFEWLRESRRDIAVGDKPYTRNLPNPPGFDVNKVGTLKSERDRLIQNILSANQRGRGYYEGKKHPVFGILGSKEWSMYFLKHLDHHLTQFRV